VQSAGARPLAFDRRHAGLVAEEAIARLLLRQKAKQRPSPWASYVNDPVGFCTDGLGEILWSKQVEILESIRDHRRTAVPSAHECSKSFTAARAVAWWIASHPFGEAFAVTTAPTAPQVRAILWREIGRAYRNGRLPGRLNQVEWWASPEWDRYSASRGSGEEMVAYGRKPADYEETSFQGIHARYVLVVIDESCGVPESLWHALGSLIGNDNSRILAIGNPDDSGSYFAKICKPDSGWNVVSVDGLLSPNFTGEGLDLPVAIREQLLGHTYVDELRQDVGDPELSYEEQTSPIFLSKVRGRFSDDDPFGVIPWTFVKRCQIPDQEWPAGSELPVELGVDVGAGGDELNIRERRGVHAGRVWRYRTPDWQVAMGHIMLVIDEVQPTKVKIDSIGIGWGVTGRLKELRSEGRIKANIVGVNVGMPATVTLKPGPKSVANPLRFPKLRDQLWWMGRELSQNGLWDLSTVDDKTIAQLIEPRYSPNSAGQIKVEPKGDTKDRLKRSPDDADALLLAFASFGVAAADTSDRESPPVEPTERQRMTMFRRP